MLDRDRFPPLFQEVRRVRETLEQYCIAGDAIPVPRDNLKYAIEQEYDVKIEVYSVPLDTDLLRGLIEFYEWGSKIYLDGELNSAWMRYVFAKEASHHLLANSEYWTENPLNMITTVLDELPIDGIASLDVQSESLTKYAAIELLFPYNMRVELKKQIEDGEKSTYEISEDFDIPEHLVQYSLADPYMSFSTSIWNNLI